MLGELLLAAAQEGAAHALLYGVHEGGRHQEADKELQRMHAQEAAPLRLDGVAQRAQQPRQPPRQRQQQALQRHVHADSHLQVHAQQYRLQQIAASAALTCSLLHTNFIRALSDCTTARSINHACKETDVSGTHGISISRASPGIAIKAHACEEEHTMVVKHEVSSGCALM